MPGHSSGGAAFGCNKRLYPSMPCLSLMYQVICAYKQIGGKLAGIHLILLILMQKMDKLHF